MVQRYQYSFLDLTVMSFLRGKVISPDAVLLLKDDLSAVLWANAAGIELFGGTGIADLLETRLSPTHPLIAQLGKAVSQINGDDSNIAKNITRDLRIQRALRTDLVSSEITRMTLPEGETAILVCCPVDADATPKRESELARMTVGALDGFADAAAIIDDYGLTLSASKQFADINIDPSELEALINEASDDSDRLVKRSLTISDGSQIAVGLGRLRDMPQRFLVVIASMNEPLHEASQEAEPAPTEPPIAPLPRIDESPANADTVGKDTITAADWHAKGSNRIKSSKVDQKADAQTILSQSASNNSDGEIETSETVVPLARPSKKKARDSADISSANHEFEAPPDIEDEQIGNGDLNIIFEPEEETNSAISETKAPRSGSILDRWFALEASRKAETGETTELQSASQDTDHHDINDKAYDEPAPSPTGTITEQTERFAFTIDAGQIIQSLSPELELNVGHEAADIVGMRWRDAASFLGFDETGTIAHLLERADTWSGKSVLWPVSGTDLVYPVDLAALPVFDSARRFGGFRGFGIIRKSDAIADPDARGMALKNVLRRSRRPFDQHGEQQANRQTDPGDHRNDDPDEGSVWHSGIFQNLEDEFSSGPYQEQGQASDEALSNIVRLPHKNGAKDGVQIPSDQTGQDAPSKIREILSQDNQAVGFAPTEQAPAASSPAFGKRRNAPQEQIGQKQIGQERTGSEQIQNADFPVLIYRGGQTLFTNTKLLIETGYRSQEELEKAGGIEALLSSAGPNPDPGNAAMEINRKDGSAIAIHAVLKRIDWNGQTALCLSFVPLQGVGQGAGQGAGQGSGQGSGQETGHISQLIGLLDTLADGIIIFDANKKIQNMSATAATLFGLAPETVTNTSLPQLFAPESHKLLEDYIGRLDQADAGLHRAGPGLKINGRHVDGGSIALHITIGKINNDQNGQYCAVLRDLDKIAENETELIAARLKAEEANRQKSEFLSSVSHEIREPLNTIIGFSDIMIEERFGPVENERYRNYLKDISRSGMHVLDLVNDLLDLSKIEAGKHNVNFEAVDLSRLASETIALLQPQANAARVIIRTSLSRVVPKVVADQRSLRQIIINLVSNAVRHSPRNSQVIVSTVFEQNGEVALRVRDTGAGMNASEIEQVMKPFAQMAVNDTPTGYSGGTGLGLPLTKALVEANRAYFELESVKGEGTVAHVQFPAARVLTD